ncbi:ATP-binding/permease protein CydD [Oligella sp. MSHR50489EDL]|uniref:thiol reductant ABC exporter subunit CydD n=1 Tax=Oligella sp. MSHR50489EDL TaxID=3139409 RepID=UPI003D812E84
MAKAEHDPAATLLKLPRDQARWLGGLAKEAKGYLSLAIAAPVLSGLLLLIQAWLLAGVLDKAIVQGLTKEALLFDIALIVLLIAGRTFITWQGERAGIKAAEKIKYLVRRALFADILSRGPAWSRQQASGSIASVLVEQVEAFDGYFSQYLPALIAGTFLPVVFALFVLPVDWVAGLLLLITAPLIPLFMALVGWGAEAASRRHLDAFARLSGFFADRVRGLSTFKLYGQAEAEAERVVEASEVLRDKTMAVLRLAFLSSATLEFFAALGVAGTALYIGLTYLDFINLRGDRMLTLQAGMFCLLMAPEVYNPLRQFAAHYHDRANARAAVAEMHRLFGSLTRDFQVAPAERAADAMGSIDGLCDAGAVAGFNATDSDIALKTEALNIPIPGRDQRLLKQLCFELKKGRSIAIMGDSGIGKSSLLETLAALRPADGTIYLSGRMLSEWPVNELRQHLVLIGQHPYVYSGTIAENLRLAAPQADDAALQKAVQLAAMDDVIEALPAGLNTHIATRGYGLSGGQLQRLALARLFLTNPEVILLDEPTANLDPSTRDAVLDNLMHFAKGRSLLMVTHDPVVALRADEVFRLSHQSLVALDKSNLHTEVQP